MVLGLLPAVAPATSDAAATTYYVSVYANESYGQAANFLTRVSPALPSGASLSGSATCSEVYANGDNGPTESVYGPNSDNSPPLDAGVHYLVTSSCTSDPSDPLSLTGTSGNLQILGDAYTITPDPTSVVGVAVEQGPASAPSAVTLSAEVFDLALENSPLPGQTVTFSVQNSADVWIGDVCSAVTAFNANDTAATASCTLPSQDVTALVQGTGAWIADFSGGTDYQGASFTGQVPGQTPTAQAALNFQNVAQQVKVTEVAVPPNCHASNENPVGIISISLYGMSCSELQVLRIVTSVIFGIATIVVAPTDLAIDAYIATTTNADALAIGVNDLEEIVRLRALAGLPPIK